MNSDRPYSAPSTEPPEHDHNAFATHVATAFSVITAITLFGLLVSDDNGLPGSNPGTMFLYYATAVALGIAMFFSYWARKRNENAATALLIINGILFLAALVLS